MLKLSVYIKMLYIHNVDHILAHISLAYRNTGNTTLALSNRQMLSPLQFLHHTVQHATRNEHQFKYYFDRA